MSNTEARNGEGRGRSGTCSEWQATHLAVPIHSQHSGAESVDDAEKDMRAPRCSYSLCNSNFLQCVIDVKVACILGCVLFESFVLLFLFLLF